MSNEIIDTEFETLPSEPQEIVQEPALSEETPTEESTPAQEEAPAPEPIIFNVDPALLIGEFLKDKEVSDDDSLNLELFLKGDSSGWRFENIPAPSLEKLKAFEPQVFQKQNQEKINAEALAFLAATDWMCLRALENPFKPVPEDIKAQRQAARDRIVK